MGIITYYFLKNIMKKMIILAIFLSLLAPVAQAGIMKKIILGGAIAYGANALANNHKQKQKKPTPQHQQPNQKKEQNQPNQVNRLYSPNY